MTNKEKQKNSASYKFNPLPNELDQFKDENRLLYGGQNKWLYLPVKKVLTIIWS